ncbi:sporulation protein [Hypoxylon sp. FL1150]|nr:sporulation protein [Hypoxylon sp. FL1150]
MAPVTAVEDASANKRKREGHEQNIRKRVKQERQKQQEQQASNDSPADEHLPQNTTTSKTNGTIAPAENTGDVAPAAVKFEKKKRWHRPKEPKEPKPEEPKKPKELKEPNELGQSKVVKGTRTSKGKKRRSSPNEASSPWKVSKPMGGRMLNIDPVLTDDEKHLIIAYNTSIQVFSADESLLIRKIPLFQLSPEKKEEQVVSICLSPSSPNHIWVASSVGHLWLIDWTNGDGSKTAFKLKCRLLMSMTVERMQFSKEFRDVPFASIMKGAQWHLVACDLRESTLHGYKTLTSLTLPILNLRSAQDGFALVASSDDDLLFGTLKSRAMNSISNLSYEFFTLDCSDEIMCLDLRAASRVHLNQKSQAETGDEPVLDVVVGCARGPVLLYNDLLPQIRRLHNSKGHRSSLQPRKYHWHRKAVHAVKWSRDGHYILSGGSESTLVMWQLDTQKMDFLPHLSASVENIVVSKRGSAYVLHLDDNSAIVLSTAEMKPTTYISGIQTLVFPQPFSKDDVVRRIGEPAPTRLLKTPAVVNPIDSSRIHLCVGNGQQISHSGSGPSTPMIQTLDLTTLQGISKQALTRTNPTDINITSKGYTITEPRITGMSYSADGKWLATTDEWEPPMRDVVTVGGSPVERREVYLKFWAVSPDNQNLELASRINAPHYTGQSEPVYSVATDPRSHRFATIGGDGVVRLWVPTIRQRDGVLVKGKLGRQLHSWACSQAVFLLENEEPVEQQTVAVRGAQRGSGAVSFSEDGSILVCAIGTAYSSVVHIIDTESGKIRSSVDGLVHGDVRDVKVLSSTLVVLSDRLVVYDLVSDELLYGVQLRSSENPSSPSEPILTHLAVDHQTSSYAIAVSRSDLDSPDVRSELAVFSPDHSEPQLVHSFPHPITAVVSSPGASGYIVLDSSAQLWAVSEGMDTKALAIAQPLVDLNLDQTATEVTREVQPLALLTGEDDEPASGDEMDVDGPDADIENGDGNDAAYAAVVPPQRLAELFDTAPAFAMPPIEDMFYQVTKLFSANSAVSAA